MIQPVKTKRELYAVIIQNDAAISAWMVCGDFRVPRIFEYYIHQNGAASKEQRYYIVQFFLGAYLLAILFVL